ncbi:hypothetical protein DFH11DRAFT_1702620 [Phellopilus nigrolimitatus]|nr:hypothetical protein DFH11DRAFT_1702620 [Phellopilus nigrolimitatus]
MLNERLELDLMQLEAHNLRTNGTHTPSDWDVPKDGIADLDLGGRKFASDTSAKSTPIPFAPSADTSWRPRCRKRLERPARVPRQQQLTHARTTSRCRTRRRPRTGPVRTMTPGPSCPPAHPWARFSRRSF